MAGAGARQLRDEADGGGAGRAIEDVRFHVDEWLPDAPALHRSGAWLRRHSSSAGAIAPTVCTGDVVPPGAAGGASGGSGSVITLKLKALALKGSFT